MRVEQSKAQISPRIDDQFKVIHHSASICITLTLHKFSQVSMAKNCVIVRFLDGFAVFCACDVSGDCVVTTEQVVARGDLATFRSDKISSQPAHHSTHSQFPLSSFSLEINSRKN